MYSKALRFLLLLLTILILQFNLVSCNTISGVGQDLEAAGKAIKRGAQEEKRY